MRATSLLATVLTATAGLTAACGDQDTPTALSESSQPAFNFANGPGSPGQSGVLRNTYGGQYAFWLYDADRELYAEVSNNYEGHCGWAGNGIALDYQSAGDGWEQLLQGQEDFYAKVWDARDFHGEPFCDWIAGRQTLAEGMVRFHEVAAGNKDDYMGTGRITRTDGLGDTNLRAGFSWDWPKWEWGGPVGIKAHTVHLGPDPRYN